MEERKRVEPLLMTDTTVRVDSWLWAIRMFKTRSAATASTRAGHVRVNGSHAKSSHSVRVGDEVRVRISGFDRVLIVQVLIVKRVGATVAVRAYRDISPPLPEPESAAALPRRDRGAGRPTKRERRELEKLRGRD